jgi:hypothetical protein
MPTSRVRRAAGSCSGRSVFIHLAGLQGVLERRLPPARATEVQRRLLGGRNDFPALSRRHGPGELTVAHLIGAIDLADHEDRARTWGRAVWQAWSEHHALIRRSVDAVLGELPRTADR